MLVRSALRDLWHELDHNTSAINLIKHELTKIKDAASCPCTFCRTVNGAHISEANSIKKSRCRGLW